MYYSVLLYLNYYSMIKNFTLIALSCFVIIFNNSCTKEVGSLEAGPFSAYYFTGAPGACATPVIAGIYAIARPLDNTNTLTLTVNVTVKGKYSVQTNAVNGVHFEAGGIFATTGPQSITLYGRGTPLKDGNFSYGILGSSSCTFTVNFLVTAPAAVFTYTGAPACTAPVISGSYATGVALGAANYIDLSLNVTSLGTYSITTNTADNIFFTASGIFSATGQQVIRLAGIGSPSSSGTFAFTPSGGGCPFNINVTNGGGTSIYSLDCAGAVIAGTYTVGASLTAANTVTIKANVTVAGTYSLSTSANGMTFSASGTFAVGANQNIVLTGLGSPAAPGAGNFAIVGGCSFSINAVAPPPANYVLTCNVTPPTGTYTVGTTLVASNRVDVEVNVSGVGGYTITSTTANNITFSKTGVFNTTGIQTVTLQGSGTPTSPAGPVNFTVGTAACPFSLNLTAPTSPCAGLTADKFTIAGQYSINSPAFGVDDGMGGFVYILQEGLINVNITFPGSTPPAIGTYSVPTVKIRSISADFREWLGVSGTIYVGATSIEFCGVNIRGTSLIPGGGIINSTCEAKF
jgi:hypothetical protein